jgi:hypothetical protein
MFTLLTQSIVAMKYMNQLKIWLIQFNLYFPPLKTGNLITFLNCSDSKMFFMSKFDTNINLSVPIY